MRSTSNRERTIFDEAIDTARWFVGQHGDVTAAVESVTEWWTEKTWMGFCLWVGRNEYLPERWESLYGEALMERIVGRLGAL